MNIRTLTFVIVCSTICLLPLTVAAQCVDCHSTQQEAIANSSHSFVDCVDCHLGSADATSFATAHDGVVKNPALLETMDQTCGQAGCHDQVVKTYAISLHATVQGLKDGAISMLGEDWGTFVGENRCGSCHATCIDCHLEKDLDGQIQQSHNLVARVPATNCKLCHDQTGTGYLGAEGHYDPSVHAEAGLVCGDCHNGAQVHGSGQVEKTLADTVDNQCIDCHTFPGEVAAHRIHKDTVDCSACHTTWYYNCYGCHGYDSETGEALGYTDFNDNRYLARRADNGKLAAVVHIPMSLEVGGPGFEKGAWVVKDRHSVAKGAIQCQDCHLNAQAFVMDGYREAPFLGAIDAEFVPKSEVTGKLVIFRTHAKMMGSALKPGKTPDSECLKCHQ